MRIRPTIIETGVRLLGGVQKYEFITAAGLKANRKVEMDVLARSRFIKAMAVKEAIRLAMKYEPDLLVPVPYGADSIGEEIADRLNIDYAHLSWVVKQKDRKLLAPRTDYDRENIEGASRIMLFDDVFTTGSSLMVAHAVRGVGQKTCAGLVLWDRSDGSYQENLPFEVASVVQSHVPLLVQ